MEQLECIGGPLDGQKLKGPEVGDMKVVVLGKVRHAYRVGKEYGDAVLVYEGSADLKQTA